MIPMMVHIEGGFEMKTKYKVDIQVFGNPAFTPAFPEEIVVAGESPGSHLERYLESKGYSGVVATPVDVVRGVYRIKLTNSDNLVFEGIANIFPKVH
jgi:hypothetical protein